LVSANGEQAMIDLGFISFASPWALSAAIALPAIWLLLRMTPPAVTRVVFPAVLLMFGLKPTERTPARTPWWLVALRMLIAALVIGGLAEPVLNAQKLGDDGPVVVVIDDTWAGAQRWPDRMNAARDIIESADLRRRPVMLIATAAREKNTEAQTIALVDAREALGRLNQLQPRPWGKNLDIIVPRLQQLTLNRSDVFWLSDGVANPRDPDMTAALQALGPLSVIGARADSPILLNQPRRTAGDAGTTKIELQAKRIATALPPLSVTLQALDPASVVIADTTLSFNGEVADAVLVLPNELANRIARFEIAGHASAASVAVADDRWQQRPVGIFSAAVEGTTAPLLEDGFYLSQALAQTAEVRVGTVKDLLARPLSMLAVSGGQRLSDDEMKIVGAWVENGGLLVRFAGPRLDPAGDALLPVKLRVAGRNLGGALSWGDPAGLGPFPDASPFARLPVPDDIKVNTQILAEPSPELPERTWARLSDGTPLITAARRGSGWVVLFHVTATPEWSNLPLSGLFVSMLQTMLNLSQGVTGDDVEAPALLPPVSLLDGFGRAVPPGPTAAAIASESFASTVAGVDAPPGLYGTPRAKFALNLGPAVWAASPIDGWPAGVTTASLDTVKGERDLKPWVLLAALLLLLADFVLSFALRGLMPLPSFRRVAATAAVLIIVSLSTAALAQKPDAPLDPAMVEAVLKTRLAYVATGSSELDRVADSGLAALTRVLAARTSAEMDKPAALNLSSADIMPAALMPYPLIYWRVSPEQPLPSGAGVGAVNEYFRHGGMIVFDAPDNVGALGSEGGSAGAKLRQILARIDTPPVMPLKDDHVLTRSFYLLPGLPGRYVNGTLYVERGSTANDGVSSVIIGGHDWAAAWARDASGSPLYPVVPGGEQQRESAYRAGVNMVMYALTGNYKADQVHLPAIMQRLTQ
jgi:hypothetical protein